MSTFLQLVQRLRRESGRSGSGVSPTSLIAATTLIWAAEFRTLELVS